MVGTITTIALIAASASAASSAVGQVKAGKAAAAAGSAAQEAANSEAAVSDYNASVADMQAQDAIARGTDAENRYRSQVRGLIGSQRAGFAGSNVDVGFGSAVDTQADAAYLGELDALQIRTNAAREAWGYQVQALDARKRAAVTRKEGVNMAEAGQQQKTAAYIGAGTTLLGATSSLLQARYGMRG